jgi:branched-chain amino acid transport system ATP-binding protein
MPPQETVHLSKSQATIKENGQATCSDLGVLAKLMDQRDCILKVEGLTKAFGGQTILDNLSLALKAGDVALLRGDNGSGKTTLLNILTGYLEPDAGTIEIGSKESRQSYQFPVKPWQRLQQRHFSAETFARSGGGRVWQDVRLFGAQSLQDNVAVAAPRQIGESPLWAVLKPWAVRRKRAKVDRSAVGWLAEFGLAGRENSLAERVSLGQSKRVAIARTLQSGAKVIFLDEPLAGLDAVGMVEVLGLLKQLATEQGLTLVIVEHVFNIPKVLDLATTVWTMVQGKVQVESVESVRSQLERTVFDGVDGWVQQLGSQAVEWLPNGALWATVVPGETDGEPLLEVDDLVVYRGKRLVIGESEANGKVKGLSLRLRRGELGVLYAPNGWGKTTLLEAVMGILPISSGTIRVRGRPVMALSSWQRVKLGLAFLQARENVFVKLLVREVLRLSRVREVPTVLQSFLPRQVSELSGGQRQRVATTCVLAGRSFEVGLLDEPFSALDPEAVAAVQRAILDRLETAAMLIAIPKVTGNF